MKTSLCLSGFLAAMLGSSAFAQDVQLRVTDYGGVAGKALDQCVNIPFSKATGIKIVKEPGVSLATLAKLRQERASPTIDIAWMDGGISELAEADGLLAAIPATLSNLEGVVAQAKPKNDKGEIFAVAGGYAGWGIAYRTDEVKTKPASWNDLWDAKYRQTVIIPSPNNSIGAPFVTAIAKISGGSVTDIGPGIEKLKALKVAAYFDTSANAEQAYQSGEAVIGAASHLSIMSMMDRGVAIAFAVPKEGVLATDMRAHIVKNSRNIAAAEKFIDYLASPEALTCVAETAYFGPPLKAPKLTEKAAARMPWGATGSVENLSFFDWVAINKERAKIVEVFNQQVAQQK